MTQNTDWKQFVVFWQVIGQSLEAGVVFKHVVTLGNALLIASLHIILHRLLPAAQQTHSHTFTGFYGHSPEYSAYLIVPWRTAMTPVKVAGMLKHTERCR